MRSSVRAAIGLLTAATLGASALVGVAVAKPSNPPGQSGNRPAPAAQGPAAQGPASTVDQNQSPGQANRPATPNPQSNTPGNDNRPAPGTNTPGNDNRPAPGTNTPGNDNRPAPGTNTPGNDNRPAPGTNTPGNDNRPAPGTNTPGNDNRPAPGTNTPGNDNRPAPGAQRITRIPASALQAARITVAPTGDEAISACLDDLPKGLAANVSRPKVDRKNPAVPSGPVEDLECDESGVASAYIVQFKPGVRGAAEVTKAREAKMRVTHVFRNVFDGMTVWATPGQLVRLKKNPNFTLVEPDGAVQAINQTQQPATWGLDRVDQRTLPLNSSYSYASTAANVQAYVIDTGIRSDHVDFEGRVGSGYTSIIDGGSTQDCNGHGTHVAGTIGGSSYGVAKGVTLRPVRVLDCSGSGTWSGVIAGLDWIGGVHQPGTPAVANMSLGGGANSSVDTAVRNLIGRGVNVVVAAGNSNADACNSSPARVAPALTVGATTSNDDRASYSNFGTCLDIFAPGSSITSAWHTSPTAAATISGTSMAAPHVAGAAALILADQPALNPDGVAAALLTNSTADVVRNPGTGSPNRLLFTLLASSPDVPEEPVQPEEPENPDAELPQAPTGVAAQGGKRQATVTWTAPESDGGSALTGYTVRAYEVMKNGRVRLVGAVFVSADQAQVTLTGMKAGSRFQFTVAATNVVGTGPESTPSNVVAITR
jgi:subtilisin family serine protease